MRPLLSGFFLFSRITSINRGSCPGHQKNHPPVSCHKNLQLTPAYQDNLQQWKGPFMSERNALKLRFFRRRGKFLFISALPQRVVQMLICRNQPKSHDQDPDDDLTSTLYRDKSGNCRNRRWHNTSFAECDRGSSSESMQGRPVCCSHNPGMHTVPVFRFGLFCRDLSSFLLSSP